MLNFTNATISELNTFGASIAEGMELIDFKETALKALLETGNISEAVQETLETLNDDATEAWAHYTSYSPFEFYAKELNDREDSDSAWDAMLDGFYDAYGDTVQALESDIKEYLVEAIDDIEVSKLGIELPEWIESDLLVCDVYAISEGGCASGAYMPAVTYFIANATMAVHGDDVLEYIESTLGEIPTLPDNESWSGIAVHFLSIAVELFAGEVVAQIDSMKE